MPFSNVSKNAPGEPLKGVEGASSGRSQPSNILQEMYNKYVNVVIELRGQLPKPKYYNVKCSHFLDVRVHLYDFLCNVPRDSDNISISFLKKPPSGYCETNPANHL